MKNKAHLPSPSHLELNQRLVDIAEQGPDAVEKRISELEGEWTSGRIVKATTGLLLALGLALTVWVSPWWLILLAISGVILLQDSLSQHSWLGGMFYSCGYRSGSQIEEERTALRVLRGDYRDLPTLQHIEEREAIDRMEGEGGIALKPEEAKYSAKDAAAIILEVTVNPKVADQEAAKTSK